MSSRVSHGGVAVHHSSAACLLYECDEGTPSFGLVHEVVGLIGAKLRHEERKWVARSARPGCGCHGFGNSFGGGDTISETKLEADGLHLGHFVGGQAAKDAVRHVSDRFDDRTPWYGGVQIFYDVDKRLRVAYDSDCAGIVARLLEIWFLARGVAEHNAVSTLSNEMIEEGTTISTEIKQQVNTGSHSQRRHKNGERLGSGSGLLDRGVRVSN
mmetsp:Transcript_28400/g.67214  ORF Transcript_28400/g.67214 Transcript_28400/m.67214 type:complete len:213 (+) Transcript_28400:1075-1713(+)